MENLRKNYQQKIREQELREIREGWLNTFFGPKVAGWYFSYSESEICEVNPSAEPAGRDTQRQLLQRSQKLREVDMSLLAKMNKDFARQRAGFTDKEIKEIEKFREQKRIEERPGFLMQPIDYLRKEKKKEEKKQLYESIKKRHRANRDKFEHQKNKRK